MTGRVPADEAGDFSELGTRDTGLGTCSLASHRIEELFWEITGEMIADKDSPSDVTSIDLEPWGST